MIIEHITMHDGLEYEIQEMQVEEIVLQEESHFNLAVQITMDFSHEMWAA